MQIIVSFENDVANAPSGFKACVNAVCQYYDALFTSNVTVNLQVGWGTVAGQKIDAGALGESSTAMESASYSQVAAALAAQKAPGSDTLPATAPTTSTLMVTTAEARALGVDTSVTPLDGSVGFDSTSQWFFDPTQAKSVPSTANDFMGTVEHEVSEVMGRGSSLNLSGSYTVLDLYRYSGAGMRQLGTGDASYFSLDGGKTALAYFNNFQTGDTGDLGDWAPSTTTQDSFNDDGGPGAISPVTNVDKQVMASLGWTTTTASTSLSVAAAVPTLSAASAVSDIASGQDAYVTVSDSGANVGAQIDHLEALAKNGNLAGITLTSSGLTVTTAQLVNDADALALVGSGTAVSDSGANIVANLATLAADAASGLISQVSITDAGFTDVTLTAAQLASDGAFFKTLSGNYYATIDATAGTALTLAGISGHGTIVALAGSASQYTLTPSGDGTGFTIASASVTDHISGITALQFGSAIDIVAATPGSGGTVTSGNITELYGAVFGREPDVPGLAYYQAQVSANPSIPLTQYAANFLQSPEYVNNSAHNYAQTTAGDTQFINDSYQNLLHRVPESGAVPYYLNLISLFTQNLTPGTAAYAAAELQAHATVITDFSQSAEFLGNVQITAAHPADTQHWLYLI
jgi:hypothetical protein